MFDHDEHVLFVEDIPDEVINSPEWDGEESYILNNYDIDNFSWEYIVETHYFPEDGSDPVEIRFDEFSD